MKITIQQAKKELFKHGWSTLWNDNYWVHSGIMRGANLDYCGVGMEDAILITNKNFGTNYQLLK